MSASDTAMVWVVLAVEILVVVYFCWERYVRVSGQDGDGMQDIGGLSDGVQEEYAKEMKDWNDQLSQQESLRREVLMNEFAQYVWAVVSVGQTADEEREGTKVLSVAPDMDVLRITTAYGLVVKATFSWGRRTKVRAEAEFFGVRRDGQGGYVLHEAKTFRGSGVSLPLRKVSKWAYRMAGEAVGAIMQIGKAAEVGSDGDAGDGRDADGKDGSAPEDGGRQG